VARTALRSLRNEDFSDRELLHILNDLADNEGWATTEEIADALHISPPGRVTKDYREKYGKHCVATRYSWMVRYGWVERDPSRTKWRLTEIGEELMAGNLNKRIEDAISQLSSGDRILVMRRMTEAFRIDREEAATMLRREWLHGARRNGR
jgi:hypothetical protein